MVRLPDKKVRHNLGAPCDELCGEQYFYSDQGNDLDNSMSRAVAGGGALTAKVKYEIEDGRDYAFLEASSDGGQTWESVDTSENYNGTDESGLDPDDTGISGNTGGVWVDLTATVPNGTNAVRWRYVTDGATSPRSRSTTSPWTARRSAPPRPTRAGRSTASAGPRGSS